MNLKLRPDLGNTSLKSSLILQLGNWSETERQAGKTNKLTNKQTIALLPYQSYLQCHVLLIFPL